MLPGRQCVCEQVIIWIQGQIHPVLFLPLSPLLSMGKFKDRINSNVSNYLFSHNFGRANSRRCRTVCKCRRTKITPYTVVDYINCQKWALLMMFIYILQKVSEVDWKTGRTATSLIKLVVTIPSKFCYYVLPYLTAILYSFEEIWSRTIVFGRGIFYGQNN